MIVKLSDLGMKWNRDVAGILRDVMNHSILSDCMMDSVDDDQLARLNSYCLSGDEI